MINNKVFYIYNMNSKIATVYRSTGSWYLVKVADGTFTEARIKGVFRTKGIRTTNPVAVGDKVKINIDENNNGMITDIIPRNNYIIRKSVNLSKESHIIASNIDLCVLVSTISNPVTLPGFIDRFSVTTQAYGIPLLIVFNKIDIYDKEDEAKLDNYFSVYEKAGCSCFKTSAINGVGIPELKERLINKVTLFAGNSGSGKSSLINALDPDIDLKVGEISETHLKGKHTTTFAEMFDLGSHSQIIDTPGIKSFGLIDFEKDELAMYFPEMLSLLKQCKYHNCRHINEPDCAVIKAVGSGKISELRYQSYLSMYNNDDQENYR